jgi:hypothetical protein
MMTFTLFRTAPFVPYEKPDLPFLRLWRCHELPDRIEDHPKLFSSRRHQPAINFSEHSIREICAGILNIRDQRYWIYERQQQLTTL